MSRRLTVRTPVAKIWCEEMGRRLTVAAAGTGARVELAVWDLGHYRAVDVLVAMAATAPTAAQRRCDELLTRFTRTLEHPPATAPSAPAGLPADLVAQAERVGRHDWSPCDSHDDEHAIIARCLAPLAPVAGADPAGFIQALASVCIPAGGWAVYGADRLILRLLGLEHDHRDDPAWLRILDGSLAHLREHLLPYHLLPAYLADHYARGADPEDWLPFREAPVPEAAAITPLDRDELRRVVEGRADSGVAVVVCRDGLQAVALLELSSPSPGAGSATATRTTVRVEWRRAHDLYDLYLDIAWGFPFRSWAHPELEPFFAGPCPSPDPGGSQTATASR